MNKSYLKFYFISLGILVSLSAYPMIMGIKIVILQLQNGSIKPEDYARYVIPYTAICISILISVALYPVISKFRQLAKPIATILGLALFVGTELFMESITINSSKAQSTVEWQLFSCIGTPNAVQAFQKTYSDAYKIHYFLVAFVIIMLVIGVVYGYGKLMTHGDRSNIFSLHLQLASAVLLIALCVFANFTGFFRDKTDYLSPLSAFLTGVFFIILGVTFGIYIGSYLIGKSKNVAVLLPTLAAMMVCSIMYYGEFMLLGGKLYRFGYSHIFTGIPYITLSLVDITIILLSGFVTALVIKATQRMHLNMNRQEYTRGL